MARAGRWTTRITRLAALFLALHAFSAMAQINITPSAPNSTDRVMISIPMGGAPGPGSPPTQVVQGALIQLEVVTNGFDWGPNPPWSQNYLVGPLLPGQYTVQFQARQTPDAPPYKTLTTQFTVIDVTQTPLRAAVDYWWPNKDHYFMTADASEISALDAGVFPGWQRTGAAINVYAPNTPLAAGLSPVCRFYGKPELGLDSHFFSASPDECQAVIDRFSNAWVYESSNVFLVFLPNMVDGSCPSNTTPVYRLYNNRPDINHRYTTSLTVRQTFMSFAWIPEGYGPLGVVMCSPQQ